MTRVLAADHHPLYREGLARLVRQSAQLVLVGEVADARGVSDAVADLVPDVVLVEPDMLGPDPRGTLTRLSKSTRLLLVAGSGRPSDAYLALGAGASAYLSKFATGEQLAHAIELVARGQTVIAPDVIGEVAADIRLREAEPRTPLSPRETEILGFIAEGLTARRIAERLHLATSTVRTHMLNLYAKLGVSDRAAAVAEGMRRGVLR